MTVDPSRVVETAAARAAGRGSGAAPSAMRRSPEPRPPLPPVHTGDEVAAVHRRWAEVHATAGGRPAAGDRAAGDRAAGALARVRDRVLRPVSAAAGTAQQEDRSLIGDLVRAVDAIARRVDELSGRLGDLEHVVQEAVAVLSEDLVRLRASAEPERGSAEDPARQ